MISSEWGFLEAKTKEEAMKEGLKKAEEFAYGNVDRYENPSGAYHGYFKFYDKVFDSEDEALAFFRSLGTCVDGVVMVKEPPKSIRKKYGLALGALETKKQRLIASAVEKFKERKSKTIGCKVCGARINSNSKILIDRNLCCPVCRNWLVSDTIKARYAKYNAQIEAVKIQYVKDCAEGGKIRYWAKYSVHC